MREDDPLREILDRLSRTADDPDALRALVDRLWPFVIALAYRGCGGNRDRAEDVAQQVFVRLLQWLRSRPLDDPDRDGTPAQSLRDPQHFLAYVATITRHALATASSRRRPRNESDVASSEHPDEEPFETADTRHPTPDQVAVRHDLERRLFELLDPKERALAERLLQGLTLAEIIERTGESRAAVSNRLFRLRKKLRATWIS